MSLIIEWIRNMMFSIDKIIYAMISKVYDLLITIARTSPLSQADILAIADRIYKLLAIFMVFKVTFSLIMYVVNPDDFTDKSKGLGKLSLNIVLVFALLILTPHIFNMAYDLQRIVLEDNAIAGLIFGEKNDKDNDFFTSAGDDMAYIAISPFFVPDVSIQKGTLYNCTTLLKDNKMNESCSGISNDSLTEVSSSSTTLYDLTKKTGSTFTDTMLKNYVTGINNKSLGMVFRKELVEAQVDGEFIMDYSYIVSTAVGVIILILLVNFCLDVSIRSIKFAFLQLIAPIPIISYIDPKSGKDGLFKKWTQLCVKTYLSLFIRLLALYFAVYIISMVGDLGLVDVVDSSYVTSRLILVIIIIGALMFAKQLPNILKDLGIKLDSDGFKLNPLKRMEEGMIGGKLAKKAAIATGGAALVGGASLLTGKGLSGTRRAMNTAIKGGIKGEKFGKNFSSSYSAGAERRKQVKQMRLDGVSPSAVAFENLKNKVKAGPTAKDRYETFKSDLDLVTNGYKTYYNTVLSSDKMAKEFERRRVAAENAGNAAEAKLWQDSIDNRVKAISQAKDPNRVALNDTNNVAFKTAEKMLNEFNISKDYSQSVYGDKGNSFEATSNSQFDSKDIVENIGLRNAKRQIEVGVDELNSKFKGDYDYDGGLNKGDPLKAINGKAKGYATAAETSEDKGKIDSLYKYVDKKSNK